MFLDFHFKIGVLLALDQLLKASRLILNACSLEVLVVDVGTMFALYTLDFVEDVT